MPHILLYEEIHNCAMSCAGKLPGADDKIDAMVNQLVIFLLSILTWRSRLAHKFVWRGHQLHVEIYVWRNKAFLVEHVQVRSTDELDHGTSRECRNASVETGIVPIHYNDTHVPGGVRCPSLAKKTGLLSLLAKVEKSLQVLPIQLELDSFAHNSTV